MATILETLKITPGQATEAYIKLRDKKKEKDEAHKEAMQPLVRMMDQIEAGLLEFLDGSGSNSIASSGRVACQPSAMAAAAWTAVSVPLNLSGATSTRCGTGTADEASADRRWRIGFIGNQRCFIGWQAAARRKRGVGRCALWTGIQWQATAE